MVLHVVSPLFAGEQPPEEEIWRRINSWEEFTREGNDEYEDLKAACGDRVSIIPYRPGKEIYLPSKKDKYPIKVTYPPSLKAIVPKGLVVRLHLLAVLYQPEQSDGGKVDPANVVFACIDGSGAFDFDSLKLLVQAFTDDENIDVRHRGDELRASFFDCDLSGGLLPDGQAGCWGFRLRCAPRLPLTANEYEIEFDLLSSAVEAQLKISYTAPLSMPRQDRYSSATDKAISMSIRKLEFIRRKLRITSEDIAKGWQDFESRFAGKAVVNNILPGYAEEVLRAYRS